MHHAQALLAGALALVGTLATGAVDGHIELAEWLTAGATGLAALGAVYGVPPATRVRIPVRRRPAERTPRGRRRARD